MPLNEWDRDAYRGALEVFVPAVVILVLLKLLGVW